MFHRLFICSIVVHGWHFVLFCRLSVVLFCCLYLCCCNVGLTPSSPRTSMLFGVRRMLFLLRPKITSRSRKKKKIPADFSLNAQKVPSSLWTFSVVVISKDEYKSSTDSHHRRSSSFTNPSSQPARLINGARSHRGTMWSSLSCRPTDDHPGLSHLHLPPRGRNRPQESWIYHPGVSKKILNLPPRGRKRPPTDFDRGYCATEQAQERGALQPGRR